MPAMHDETTKGRLTPRVGPRLWTLLDKSQDLWFQSGNHQIAPEPVTGNVSALLTGDGTTTSFAIGTIPLNSLVDKVEVMVIGTAGTAATTLAVGYSGTTGAYMSASSFSSSMATAGVKTVTTVKVHETSSARAALGTFSAAWDTGAKVIVSIHYIKLPPTS